MKEMVCIVCPNGCAMSVEQNGDAITVTGNKCKRGEEFAIKEMTCPVRTICSTVKTNSSAFPVLPVRVSADIPKDKIFAVMKEINSVTVSAPVKRGDAVIKNVLGSGVDIIATDSLPDNN
ncbi:MAG: DUF1667 domain-containing protein [Clostridia bacterium]|nr:DUF1667 domain-containing protein [Clostridia bacterium]